MDRLVGRWWLASAMVVGCGGDFTATEADNAGTSGGATAGAGSGDDGDGDESDSPQPGLDESGDDDIDDTGFGESGDDDGGDGTDGNAADDCILDCGAGSCEVTEIGQRCACDADAVAYGLQCFKCTTWAPGTMLDVPRVEVRFNLTVGGELPPQSQYERGIITLRDPLSGDQIVIGETTESDLSAVVMPGSYEVHYTRIAGGGVMPRNERAVIDTLEISSDETIDIDIPIVELSGAITIGGDTPPTVQYEDAEIWLVDTEIGDEVKLGNTRDGSYTARVIPGSYDVRYRRKVGGAEVPLNGDAHIESLVVPGETEAMTFPVNVPMIDIAGAITLAGGPAPELDYETGKVSLRDPATGDEFAVGETRDTAYTARVVPGSYEVVYDRLLGGALVPINERAIVGMIDATVSDADINVPAVSISGSFTIDGATPMDDPSNDAIVHLRDLATGDEVELGRLSDGTYSRVVVPQAYAVDYAVLANAGGLPANTQATLQQVDLSDDTNLDIDIAATTVSGLFTVQGATPPTSEYDDARLFLRSATGDSVLLGNTRQGSYSVPVLPGDYDIVYVIESGGQLIPANGEATLETGLVVSGPTAHNIDVPSFAVDGVLSVGGEAPPTTPGDRGVLVAENLETGDVVVLGTSDLEAFSRSLTSGRYIVAFQNIARGEQLPYNSNAPLTCIDIAGD